MCRVCAEYKRKNFKNNGTGKVNAKYLTGKGIKNGE